MRTNFLFLSACSALIGVGMGAFGAHGLKSILSPEMLVVYKTGVTYQMWHALGLGLIAMFQLQTPQSKLLYWAGWLMFTGIILFSCSLYLLALTGVKELGMITPLGGIAFLAAWVLVALYAYKKSK